MISPLNSMSPREAGNEAAPIRSASRGQADFRVALAATTSQEQQADGSAAGAASPRDGSGASGGTPVVVAEPRDPSSAGDPAVVPPAPPSGTHPIPFDGYLPVAPGTTTPPVGSISGVCPLPEPRFGPDGTGRSVELPGGKGAGRPRLDLSAQGDGAKEIPGYPSAGPELDVSFPSVQPAIARVVAAVDGGHEEIASLPWRLQANAGLSYVDRQADPHPDRSTLSPSLADAAEVDTTAIGRILPASIIDSIDHAATVAVESPVAAGREEMPRLSAPLKVTEALHPAATGAAALAWPERLLRWLSDAHGGVTVWVRDFRLDPSQGDALVSSLRQLAHEQGHDLHRVVLNGHELWCSPSFSSESPSRN